MSMAEKIKTSRSATSFTNDKGSVFAIAIVLFCVSYTNAATLRSKKVTLEIDKMEDISSMDIDKLHLVYGYEKFAKRYLFCEWASLDQLQKEKNHRFISPKCKTRNDQLVMNIGGVPHFAFFKFSHGKHGKLQECPKPANISLYNCSNGYSVYSGCNYKCPKSSSIQSSFCILTGPENDVHLGWSSIACDNNTDADAENKNGFLQKAEVIILMALVLLSAIVIVSLICYCYKKKTGVTKTVTIGDGSERQKEEAIPLVLDPPAEGEQQNNIRETQNPSEQQNVTRDTQNAPVSPVGAHPINGPHKDKKQPTGFGELQDRYHTGDMESCGGELPNSNDVLNDMYRPMDKGSLNGCSPGKDDITCTATVKLLCDQTKDYIDEFGEYVEVVVSEENTLKGLAKEKHKEFGFKSERGVDVLQERHKYPYKVILSMMSERDIPIGVMVDYFEDKQQIAHILKIHRDCKYCLQSARRKNVQPPVLEDHKQKNECLSEVPDCPKVLLKK